MNKLEKVGLTFHEHENEKIPIVLWKKPIDKGIIEALSSPVVSIIARFEKVKVSDQWTLYLIFTLYTDEQIRKGELPKFYHLTFPTHALNTEVKDWVNELKRQTGLYLFIEHKDAHRLFPIFDYCELGKFLECIDFVSVNWNKVNKYQEINKLIIPIVRKKGRELGINLSTKLKSQATIHETLIEKISKIIFANFEPEQYLFKISSQSNLIELRRYLEDWASKIPSDSVNRILSTYGETKSEEICRTWLFCQKCIELSQMRSSKSILVAIGINESGSWWLQKPSGYSTLDIDWLVSNCETYRYLLNYRWKYLIDIKDIPLDSTEILKFYNLGKIPKRKQFNEVKRILSLAALEQKYSIEQINVIEVGKEGCEKIEFFPIKKGGLKCIFKVVVQSSHLASNCLFGEIDAVVGHIQIFVSPRTHLLVEKQLQLIMFLVSAAFRDLVVARDRIGVSKKEKQGKLPRKRINSQEGSLHKVRWIPRYKNNIDKSFADPGQMLTRLKKVAPQMRVAHTRTLPENQKASVQAQTFASEYDWILPEGVTFVRAVNSTPSSDIDSSEKIRSHFRSISLLELLFDV